MLKAEKIMSHFRFSSRKENNYITRGTRSSFFSFYANCLELRLDNPPHKLHNPGLHLILAENVTCAIFPYISREKMLFEDHLFKCQQKLNRKKLYVIPQSVAIFCHQG